MKKNLISLLLVLFSSVMKGGFQPYRKASMDLAHLKMSLFYIKGIKSSRWLVVALLAIGGSLVFLASGLVLFHTTLFVYTPWSDQVKMIIGFSFAAFYFLITGLAFSYVLSSEKWLRACRADDLIHNLEKEISPESSLNEAPKGKNGDKHRETAEPYRR
jgi:hypothetical protein